MKKEIEKSIISVLETLGVSEPKVTVEHPDDLSHGDYATGVALAYSKQLKISPKQLAEKIIAELKAKNIPDISKIEIAGPGFINFTLAPNFFSKSLSEISYLGTKFGANDSREGKEIMIEYTDPNPFKQFHIGHLMSNSVGESLSRLIEYSGAKIVRACYSGDVGLHVAKAVWGMKKKLTEMPAENTSLSEKVSYVGSVYTFGANEYEDNPVAKTEIDALNKEIVFDRTPEIDKLYQWGRDVSFKHLNEVYSLLGTKFNHQFVESEMIDPGLQLVKKGLQEGIFVESEKAIIFPGEKYDPSLHTRVFVNSFGVPTYETKELALNEKKFALYPNLGQSIIVTATEQSGYFKVLLKALDMISPNIAGRTKHIAHGMLRFASGKMSSRKGNIITGESMIEDVEELVREKIKDRDLSQDQKDEIIKKVAVGAIRYSILKQETGKDIIFDFEKSLSFEGDSGPYLQYTAVRAGAVLAKAEEQGIKESFVRPAEEEVSDLEKKLYRFPEVVVRAQTDYSSHHLSTYLIDLASEFNSYYANHKIADKGEVASAYRVALTKALRTVMVNGLWLLGVEVPSKM